MTSDTGNVRDEVVRLTQEVVVEGARVRGAFVAGQRVHATDMEALTHVLLAQQRGEPVTAGALAEELGLTTGAVTGVVDRLERAGHLGRARDARDRRRVLLECTSQGRALADSYFRPVQQRTDAVLDEFTADELSVVHRYLTATRAAMAAHRQMLKDHPPAPPEQQ